MCPLSERVRLRPAGRIAIVTILALACVGSVAAVMAAPLSSVMQLRRTLNGTAGGDRYGSWVAFVGDWNADGYQDFAVGAPDADSAPLTNCGKVHVYAGGAGGTATLLHTIPGFNTNDHFGRSIAGGFDWNGDGYGDLLVGGPGETAGAIQGYALLFHGGPSPDASYDRAFVGIAPGDQFGYSVAGPGDVDGDGYDDILIGAPTNDATGTNAGAAYLFVGGPVTDTSPDGIFTQGAANDQFGWAVASAGDFNRDGSADFVVTAVFSDVGAADAGRAYIWFGGAVTDPFHDVVLPGSRFFGTSVSPAGDVNGDGADDLIVGADGYSGNTGRAYVFFGGAVPDSVADVIFTGVASSSFGKSVAGAGDLNRDGYDDVAVGASNNDEAGTDAGRAFIYLGGAPPDLLADFIITGASAGDNLGTSVAGDADLEGDGFPDLIVGAPNRDVPSADAGEARTYHFSRYVVTSPNGGETWNVGANRSVRWKGAEPADIWLSLDGGRTFDRIRSGVGGDADNLITLRVPHAPTRFGQVRVTPSLVTVFGEDASDSLFTVQSSVSLITLAARPAGSGEGGLTVSWQTDPGPDDLAGYRLDRLSSDRPEATWQTIAPLVQATSFHDVDAPPGARYRLHAVNGWGDEILLGESVPLGAESLAVWPNPYDPRRTGFLTLSFATYGGLGGGAGETDVSLFDTGGRRVSRVLRAALPAGIHTARWDGRDASGASVSPGVYFLRVTSAGRSQTTRVTVIR